MSHMDTRRLIERELDDHEIKARSFDKRSSWEVVHFTANGRQLKFEYMCRSRHTTRHVMNLRAEFRRFLKKELEA